MPQAADPNAQPYVRRASIGGSDIGAILGVNRYKTAAQVYDDIVGVLDGRPYESIDNPHMERGRELEAAATRKFERDTRRVVTHPASTVTHPQYPFMHANVDRLILEVPTDDPYFGFGTGILEVKCPRLPGFRATVDVGVDPSYYAQVQHYLAVTNLSWASFAFLNAEDWLLHVIDVPRDMEMIEGIFTACTEFMRRVESRDRASLASVTQHAQSVAEHAQQRARATSESVVRDDAVWNAAFARLRETRAAFALAETAKKMAEDSIKELMEREGLEKVTVAGLGKLSYKEETRSNFDKDALAAEHPEIDLTRYTRRTVTKVFRPTFGRGQ